MARAVGLDDASRLLVGSRFSVEFPERDCRVRDTRFAEVFKAILVLVVVNKTAERRGLEFAKVVIDAVPVIGQINLFNFVVSDLFADNGSEDGSNGVFSVVVFSRLDFADKVGKTRFQVAELVVAVAVGRLRSNQDR